MDSIDKRNSVKKDYDLIAKQYFEEFGIIIEDIELIENSNTNVALVGLPVNGFIT